MIKSSYRSILAVMLAMVTAFLVSCSSPTVTNPPTYTPEKTAQIPKIVPTLTELRDKISALETDIQKRDLTDVGSFFHDPLGELQQKMNEITRELLPKEKTAASEAVEELFTRLEKIDLTSSDGNYQKAVDNYRAALKDFNEFLQQFTGQSE